MAARLLRRFHLAAIAVTTWTSVTGAVVGANRAQVGRVVVATSLAAGNSVVFSLGIAAAVGNGGKFADNINLNYGETYTETIIVETGQQLNAWASVVNGIEVTFFAEEVDN